MRTGRSALPSLAAMLLLLAASPAPAAFNCTITFRVANESALATLQWSTDYSAAPGLFLGEGGEVECVHLAPGGMVAFYDYDATRRLVYGWIGFTNFTGPLDITACTFVASAVPTPGDFVLTLEGATDNNGDPAVPPPDITVGAIDCPGAGICGDGALTEGETCDDGNLVDGDGCDSNCTPTGCGNKIVTGEEQCDDGNAAPGDCCSESCMSEPSSSPCSSDNDVCTDDACDGAGVCAHTYNTSPCSSDNDVCTDDACDGAGACAHTYNTGPCDDGQFCTLNDQCSGGSCSGSPRDCDDDNVCTSDYCNEYADRCAHPANTGSCDDGQFCTGNDQCRNRACSGTPISCTDDNLCTTDSCDEAADTCLHAANTAPCNDGQFCTEIDTCNAGVCVGTARTCNDDDACTQDSCDEAGNACLHEDDAACLAPQQDCMSKKLKADAKLASQLLQCQARVAAQNDISDLAECEAKARGKFTAAYAKAGICRGDEAQCTTVAERCEAIVAEAMTGQFKAKCEGAKRKAASKLTKDELGCYAKAVKKGVGVDPGCISKAQQKFAISLLKAGSCPDGGSPQALVEQYCVQPAVELNTWGLVVDVCPLPPPISSTTTTTSTSMPFETSTTTNSTTSTTVLTTTTTLGPSLLCTVTFRLSDDVTLGALQWYTDYLSAPGFFAGVGGAVQCVNLVQYSLASFNDLDAQRSLTAGLVSIDGFTGPLNIAECTFDAYSTPVAGDFQHSVVEASTPEYLGSSPVVPVPVIAISAINCM